MRKTLYYVVKKQLIAFEGFEETNGFKDIWVYGILDGKLEEILHTECENSDISEEIIGSYGELFPEVKFQLEEL